MRLKTSFTICVGSFLLFAGSSLQADDDKLSVRKIIFTDSECQVTHKGVPSATSFSVRVNANSNDVDFRANVSSLGCKVIDETLPLPAYVNDAAPRFYPLTSKFGGTSSDFSREELLKFALGKLVKVTRLAKAQTTEAPSSGADSSDKGSSKNTPVSVEAIEGRVIGFTPPGGNPLTYTLKLVRNEAEIVQLDSKDILGISLLEVLDAELNGILNRLNEYDAGILNLKCDAELANVHVTYTQKLDANHKPLVKIRSTLSSNVVTNLEGWTQIWNDTFYDWKDVTVILKQDADTYFEVGNVNLRFGEQGVFKLTSPLPGDLAATSGVILTLAADNKSADAQATLTLKNNDPTNAIPKATWTFIDEKENVFAKDVSAPSGIAAAKILTLAVPSEPPKVVAKPSPGASVKIEIDGDRVIATKGTRVQFNFTGLKLNFRAVIDSDDVDFRRLGFEAITDKDEPFLIVLKPNLTNSRFDQAIASDRTIDLVVQDSPVQRIEESVFQTTTRQLSVWQDYDANPVEKLAEIASKKDAIDSAYENLATLQNEKKNLLGQQRIGEPTSYRGAMQRDLVNRLQKKDAEILERRNEIGKLEFQLTQFAESLGSPVEAIRKLGGEVTVDSKNRLVSVFFSPGSSVRDAELLSAIDGATGTLSKLVVSGCRKIEGKGLCAKLQNTNLQWLDLSDTSVDGNELEALSTISRLRSLDLAGTNTSTLADAIGKLVELQHLNVAGTEFDDCLILHLCSLKKLQSLNVRGTRVTGEGIKKLMAKLPKLEVMSSEDPIILDAPGTIIMPAPNN